jgi:hypothetical protein
VRRRLAAHGPTDGRPLGAATREDVPFVDGSYDFLLPPRSAAILFIDAA